MIPKVLNNSSQYLSVFIFCAAGCFSCFSLQKYLNIPSFYASALVGLIGSFLPNSRFYDSKRLIACIYCGSFASMCSLTLFTSSADIFILCSITGCYFLLLGNYFRGFGGKLGTIGFLSSLSFVIFKGIL
jgi:hypothetical protein